MTKYETIKEMVESPSKHMHLIKDVYVVNDFETILYNKIEENNICLGITAITDNNIVYRGLSNGNDFSYITQILDSIPRIISLKLVCCSMNRFETKDSKNEILSLLNETFSKYKPSSIELIKSKFIIIDSSGNIEYDNKKYTEEQDKKIK